jgi:hypothetical protein
LWLTVKCIFFLAKKSRITGKKAKNKKL